MKVAELFAYLGIVADEKKAKDFFNILEDGKRTLFNVAAMAVGTEIGLGSMLNKAMDAALALSNFTAETGLSAQELQAWQHVGEAMSGTADDMTNSITNLNKGLLSMQKYGRGQGASVYAELGINPKQVRDVWELLDILRGHALSGHYSPTIMAGFLQELGVTGPMMKVFMADFEKYANRSTIITKSQEEQAVRFNASLKELGQTITWLFNTAFSALEPEMTAMLGKVENWVKLNQKALKDWIVGIFGGLNEGMRVNMGNMEQTLSKIVDLVNRFTGDTKNAKNFYDWAKIVTDAIVLFNPAALAITSFAGAIAKLHDVLYGKGSALQKLGGVLNLPEYIPAAGAVKDFISPVIKNAGTTGKAAANAIVPPPAPGTPGLIPQAWDWLYKSLVIPNQQRPENQSVPGSSFMPYQPSEQTKQRVDESHKAPIIQHISPEAKIHVESNTNDPNELADMIARHVTRAINVASLQIAGQGAGLG